MITGGFVLDQDIRRRQMFHEWDLLICMDGSDYAPWYKYPMVSSVFLLNPSQGPHALSRLERSGAVSKHEYLQSNRNLVVGFNAFVNRITVE